MHINRTVDDLKQESYDLTGYHIDAQRIIFSGRQLEDGRIILDYNIHNGALLHLVLRLRGC
jgi:Ubiquitin family